MVSENGPEIDPAPSGAVKPIAPCVIGIFLFFLSMSAHSLPPQQADSPDWQGAKVCARCHQQEYKDWRKSHHDLAMQAPSETAVLGNFKQASFKYNGVTTRFYRRGGRYWVRTDGPDGKLQDYPVQYVFGVHPLQQYLLALPGGRLHALSIAWDSRPKEEGGQRWFHLYPEENIDADDPLHWTGPYHNWNARCAECHSTHLQKNFNHRSLEYATTWSEVNVSCEACHGPGAQHVALATQGKLWGAVNGGFPVDISAQRRWRFKGDDPVASPDIESKARGSKKSNEQKSASNISRQVEICGRCHARRGALGDYHHGEDLLNTHRVSLLEPSLYHLDGQILDEVYVYGSFLQSRMHQAGVVCSNCHNPHSLELLLPDNLVCSQCHRPDVYDTSAHHHHPAGSEGAVCANCHMPTSTYMIVDPRRDHSLRVPRPDLSVVVGTPNACNGCHTEKDAQWALDALRGWGVQFSDTATQPAHFLQRARTGDDRAVPDLQSLAMDSHAAPIWRATAMAELGGFSNRQAYDTALHLLDSPDPMLRMSAVRALEFLPPQELVAVLGDRLKESSAAVRFEMARLLAAVPKEYLDSGDNSDSSKKLHSGSNQGSLSSRTIKTLFDEYESILNRHGDMPEMQVQLGLFHTARQHWQAAETAYHRALEIHPRNLPALLNLADLFRLLDREDEARELLAQAVAEAPEQGAPHYALGLLEIRTKNRQAALKHLAQAARLETQGVRHRYVYAVALHDSGQPKKALEQLRTVLRIAPQNQDILLALVTYNRELGRLDEARRYAALLRKASPGNPQIQRLYESLGR